MQLVRRVSRLSFGSAVCIGLLTAASASAADFLQQYGYQTFGADLNGDGVADVILEPRQSVVAISIDDDLVVPIPIPSKGPSLRIVSSPSGRYSIIATAAGAGSTSSAWRKDTHEITYLGAAGSTAGRMFVRALNSDGHSFVVSMSSSSPATYKVQEVTTSLPGLSFSDAGVGVEASDQNADGISDLLVRRDGLVKSVLVGTADGTIQVSEEVSVKAIWRAFVQAFKANDPGAIGYVTPYRQALYQEGLFKTDAAAHARFPASAESTLLSISAESAELAIEYDDWLLGKRINSSVIMTRDTGFWLIYGF